MRQRKFIVKIWDWHIHAGIFKIEKQKGSIVQPKEDCLIFCNNLNG